MTDDQLTKEDLVGPNNQVQMDMRDPHLDKVSLGDTRYGTLKRETFCFRK